MGKIRVGSPTSGHSSPVSGEDVRVDDVLRRVHLLEAERDSLRDEVESLREASAAEDEPRRVRELEAKLRRAREQHEVEKEELERKRTEDLGELWDEHWRRVAEMEKLKGDSDSFSDNLREALREMERENVQLKSRVRAHAAVAEQLQQMEEEMRALAAGVDEKDREIAQKDAVIADLRRRVGAVADADVLRETQSALARSEETVAELREMLHDGAGASPLRERVSELEEELAATRRGDPDRDRELLHTQRALLRERDEQLADCRHRLAELEDALAGREDVSRLQEELIRGKQEKLDNLVRLVDELRDRNRVLRGDSAVGSATDDDRWERGSAGSTSVYSGYRLGGLTDTVGSACGSAGEHAYRRRRAWEEDSGSRARGSVHDSGYSSGASESRQRAVDHPPPWRSAGRRDRQDAASRSSSIVDRHARTPVRREWEALADGGHQPQTEGRPPLHHDLPPHRPARGSTDRRSATSIGPPPSGRVYAGAAVPPPLTDYIPSAERRAMAARRQRHAADAPVVRPKDVSGSRRPAGCRNGTLIAARGGARV